MRQFIILLKKECLESWRNYKVIWMPLVFILLSLVQPITTYYMPQILKAAGSMPKGAIIKIPTPSAPEVLYSTIDQQYNMIGILVIVLAFMASVTGEKKNGNASLILVKPVSFTAFIMAKWTSAILLVWLSYVLGMVANWYYTYRLFDWVNIGWTVKGMLTYGLWLTFIVTLVFFFGSFVNSTGLNAFFSLGVTIVLNFVTSFFSKKLLWLPSQLSNYTGKMLELKAAPDGTLSSVIVTIILIGLLLGCGVFIFKRKELV